MRVARARIVRLVVVTAAVLVVTGCAQPTAAPPPPPPAPTQLTISGQRGQTQAQQSRDRAECESWATQQAMSSAGWAATFAECMTARGYSVR
jgi:hypothetical protein